MMTSACKRTLILSFDMETDIGSWTSGQRGLREGTIDILCVLASHNCRATFLFTGTEAQSNPALVERILHDGHEIGCHTMFHETIGKPVYWTPFANFVLDSEIRGRLELATDAVEKVAGVRPVSFRAPRLFGSTAMLNALEDLGYVADSSFPAYFHGRDFLPYHPSQEDWSKDGDMNLLEIPPFFNIDASDSSDGNRERDQWPMMRMKGADWFSGLSREMFNRVSNSAENSVLCVYLHPWEFVDMPRRLDIGEVEITLKPFLYTNCGGFAVEALDRFIGQMQDDEVGFVRMADYAINASST